LGRRWSGLGRWGKKTSKVEDRGSKIEIPASDKPGEAQAGEVTIVQMRTMFLELEHPDGKVRERARES